MSLEDLVKFVTGSKLFCSAAAPEGIAAMGVKRKPELFDEPDEDHRQSLFIYNMTMSKLVTSTPTRHKPVEPSLQRSVLIRNTLRRLEASISMSAPVHPPHSPRKKLQCVGWPVAVTSTDSQTDFQLLLNGLVISGGSEESGTFSAPSAACSAAADPCTSVVAAMEVEQGSVAAEAPPTAAAEEELAVAALVQGQTTAQASSVAHPLLVSSHPLLASSHAMSASDVTKPPSMTAGDVTTLTYVGEVDRVLVPRKDSTLYSLCSSPASIADGLPRGVVTEGGFDEIDVSLLSELDAFCSAAAATRAASVVEEFDGVGCAVTRDVRYDELDNILQVLVGM